MTGEPSTVFREPQKNSAWRLGGLILLSLCLHSLGFYAFQATYPIALDKGKNSAQIALATFDREDQHLLRAWASSEDPSLLNLWRPRPPLEADLRTKFIPSYATAKAGIKEAELDAMPFPVQILKSPVAIQTTFPISLLTPSHYKPNPAEDALRFKTSGVRIHFFTRARSHQALRPIQLKTKRNPALQPCTLYIGISPAGAVLYTICEQTSNIEKADQYAINYARSMRFTTASALTWAKLSFYWGTDIFQ